jgi:chemotaxis protein methyltransferase CheR
LSSATPALLPKRDDDLGTFVHAIYRAYRYDFRNYTEGSMRRRLRNALTYFQEPNLDRLRIRVLEEPQRFTELLRFLTTPTTDMFRDPIYFRALRQVIRQLDPRDTLKVWIPCCGTGEEVYSLAILLFEEGVLDRTLMYATDPNAESLRAAEAGVYTTDRLVAFKANYELSGGQSSLTDYYSAGYGNAVLDRELKRAIVFFDHSMVSDDAFAMVQLVSCRNVLLYFARELQERALAVLSDSLMPSGYLGLGLKESLRSTTFESQFVEIDRDARLYQKP